MQETNPIQWGLRPIKRYADFSGRAPRAEYWWFVFFEWLALMAFVILAVTATGDSKESNSFFYGFIVPFCVAFVMLIIPNVAVQVRRLHDQDRSGWLVLLFCIPYVGGLISLIFMLLPGTEGPNRYGPDPYGRDQLEEVFA